MIKNFKEARERQAVFNSWRRQATKISTLQRSRKDRKTDVFKGILIVFAVASVLYFIGLWLNNIGLLER